MMARDAYAPDMLTTMMTAGDALLNGVAGRVTFYTPEDVNQGAASAGDGSQAFTHAMQSVAATANNGAASGMLNPTLTAAVPDILTSPVAAVTGFFERGLFGALALVVIAGGLYLFAQE